MSLRDCKAALPVQPAPCVDATTQTELEITSDSVTVVDTHVLQTLVDHYVHGQIYRVKAHAFLAAFLPTGFLHQPAIL